MNNYKKILIVLVGFLFLNTAYSLNSYSFIKDIKNTMTYQVFKDLKIKDNINIEEAERSVDNYIAEVLKYELDKRNNILEILLTSNIVLIILCILIWLFHYIYIQKNRKTIVMKTLIVFSVCWLIIISLEAKLKVFLGTGLLPIVLIFGAVWIIEEFMKIKNKEQ